MNKRYCIWRTAFGVSRTWLKTAHVIEAKNQEQAHKKLQRMFKNAGFSNITLVAIPEGGNPND